MRPEDIFNNDSEIDIKVILRFIGRNKFKIFNSTILGFLISFFAQLSAPKMWKGEFQIVLNTPSSENSNSITENLAKELSGLGLNQNQSDLQTQIEILTSPSVLLEIFEYVKVQKSIKDDNFEKLSFFDWKQNLNVELKENTSVLNLAYIDNDKTMVLPVLERISNEYVLYNTKKKQKEINMDLKFYSDQIDIYRLRSIEYYKIAQQFAIDNDFTFDFDLNFKRQLRDDTVENTRVSNSNKIKYLKEKLKQIENMSSESEEIIYFANSTRDFSINNLLLSRLNKIDEKLSQLRNIYHDKDNVIQNLKDERSELISALRKDIITSINSEILDKEALVDSSKRPKEILLKYSELVNQARKYDDTLNLLENQKRALSLELSKKEYPWDLITKPTLLPNPFAPNKDIYLLLGIFLGALSGTFFSIFIEKKKDLLFATEDLENIFNIPVLEETSTTEIKSFKENLKFISSNPRIIPLKNIGIIFPNNIDKQIENEINEACSNIFKDKKIYSSSDFRDLSKSTPQIIVIELNTTIKSNLINQINKLFANEISILGFVVIK